MRRPERIEVDLEELESILERTRPSLDLEDHATLKAAIETLAWLTAALEAKRVALGRLKKILFGTKTEKTSKVLAQEDPETPSGDSPTATAEETGGEKPEKKCKGHGRNGAAAYVGAEQVKLPHESLHHGDCCPECRNGNVYVQDRPGVVRVRGQAPLMATVIKPETMRCNLCGQLFKAKVPEDVGRQSEAAEWATGYAC
jgi:transposase